jgi:hypothetical protein
VAALDVADARVVEGVVGGQVGSTRDPEYVLDALGLEALHDGVDGSHDGAVLSGRRTPPRPGAAEKAVYQRLFRQNVTHPRLL